MISPIKKIIISIDFSEKSLNALHTAIQMTRRHSAELHLLYVIDANHIFPVVDVHSPIAKIKHEPIAKDMFVLEELARSITFENGIECTCHQRIGFPVSTVCDIASELDCDLVVVATEEQDGLSYLFDSNAYRVLKSVGCSVLAVPAAKQVSSFKKVIFPVGAANDVAGKYNFSRTILKLNNSKVILMGLMDRPTSKLALMLKGMITQFGQWMKEDCISHISGTIAHTDPAIGTTQAGEDFETDLVIINASTRRNLIQFFTGNYTQRIMGRQEFAVLCYQPKRETIQQDHYIQVPLHLSFS
ncbi:MAG: universal stress protein [Pedobacter sp.]|jgi:nucleotide-binding universal stress UspA family protein|uniref:universal stress protein n=1 Tax=Pedobacter sp. TaxID=1411316 RepID=UPI00356621DA